MYPNLTKKDLVKDISVLCCLNDDEDSEDFPRTLLRANYKELKVIYSFLYGHIKCRIKGDSELSKTIWEDKLDSVNKWNLY